MSNTGSQRRHTVVRAVLIPATLATLSVGLAIADRFSADTCQPAVTGQVAPVVAPCPTVASTEEQLVSTGREGAGRPCQGGPGC